MYKRKYGSRYDWKRITKRNYTEMRVDTQSFVGFVSLLHIKELRVPLRMTYADKTKCIADNGYYWLQHFPEREQFSVTTVINSSGQIVQWYIDICKQNGYCNEKGPWMDDLFLDLIVLPTGEVFEKDVEEIEVALEQNLISQSDYEIAWMEFNRIKSLLVEKPSYLLELTVPHFKELSRALV